MGAADYIITDFSSTTYERGGRAVSPLLCVRMPRRPDDAHHIIPGLTRTTYDRKGRPLSLLSAARMLHYPDDDTTELSAPHMLQTRPAEPRTSVTAERGAGTADGG